MSRFVRLGCGVLIGGAMLVLTSACECAAERPSAEEGAGDRDPWAGADAAGGDGASARGPDVRPAAARAGVLQRNRKHGVSDVVQLVPESQVRGTTALDTLPATMAREGGVPSVGPLAVHRDSTAQRTRHGGHARGREHRGDRGHAPRARGAASAARLAATDAECAGADAGRSRQGAGTGEANERCRFRGASAGDRIDSPGARVSPAASGLAPARSQEHGTHEKASTTEEDDDGFNRRGANTAAGRKR